MSQLFNALSTNDSLTDNGALTHSTTNNALLDLFFIAGASRTMNEDQIISMFTKSLAQEEKLTLQLLLWARDARGGAGERRFFRVIYKYLKYNYPTFASLVTPHVATFGRWDDLWETGLNEEEKALIKKNIDNGLLCKWIPRRKQIFFDLANYMGMTLSNFRKLIVKNSKTVEQQMSAKEWSDIKYESVPSKAMSIYNKAFGKRDFYRFNQYIQALQSGETKINASVLYPYDLIRAIRTGKDSRVIDEQWKALPNYYTDENILVVADTSGSMNGLPIEVCISLAIYTSERNSGIFKDKFITFSGNPTIQQLSGSLTEKNRQLNRADWSMNTNLQAVFNLILDTATKAHISENDMPTKVIIISDMQFDQCCTNTSNFDSLVQSYALAGYKLPQLVFWNVKSKLGNNPVKVNQNGVALVSGASPSILQSVLGDLSPVSTMMQTINQEKYQVFK